MFSIYDCSNSLGRPHHRGFGGPVENTIVRDLKRYAANYSCKFVSSIREADVAFTNDIFTDDILDSGLPRVKRMDGVFFQESLLQRNVSLNLAATQADLVIFISEFSKQSYQHLYGRNEPLKNQKVILNWVDPFTFTFKRRSGIPYKFISIATSWERPEKRVKAIIELAKANSSKQFYLIGKYDSQKSIKLTNVHYLGYTEDESVLNSILHEMDAMICTAYRDAAPKTVAQGLSCGLPCFYANSGGVPELVGTNGLSFGRPDEHKFTEVPVEDAEIFPTFLTFCKSYDKIAKNMKNDENRFRNVIGEYFEAIKMVS